VWAAGSIAGAVGAAKRAGGFSTKVEVEARGLEEAMEAAGAGADVVMLDNYTDPADLHRDAAALKARFPAVLVEASGGITLDTVRGYMGPHVDVVSVGSLTQGYAVADFSLKVSMGKGVERIKAVVEAGGKQ
jgi:nicotinate-nucleotide pyrophosphorylase (carboxylating)